MFEDRIAALNQANTEKMAIESTQYDKRTYTVDEIQDILGISRTSAYNLVKKNYFRCVRIGGMVRSADLGLSRMSVLPATNFRKCYLFDIL